MSFFIFCKVQDLEGWGAIYAAEGASDSLFAAFGNNCASFSTYASSGAVGLIWSEGRSQSTEGKIYGILSGLLSKFTSYFATVWVTKNSASIPGCLSNGGSLFFHVSHVS